MASNKLKYIIITPAHNEEKYIEYTIKSMIDQTVIPEEWIIVNDGSIDKTGEIVESYKKQFPWIKLINKPVRQDRQFAAKVHAFNSGFAAIVKSNFDVIGNLDADLSFDEQYFEFLLSKFSADKNLGVAGTPFVEKETTGYNYNYTNIKHVSGACQLFRRECFHDIGGYVPVKGGGIDWIAVTTARMRGWRTQTFTEKHLFHYREMGTGIANVFKARFNLGKKDYSLGNGLVWELFRALYQMTYKPRVLGGFVLLSGYLYALVSQQKRPISQELVNFTRKEQWQRLKRKFIKEKIINKG